MKIRRHPNWLMVLLFSITLIKSFPQNDGMIFSLADPLRRFSHSKYCSLSFLDSRVDTLGFGFVYPGFGRIKRSVIIEPPLSSQLSFILKNSVDSTCEKNELVFQLRKLKFIENPSMAAERGICLFRANLYLKAADNYYSVESVDTVISLEAPEATASIFKAAAGLITGFLLNNLGNIPSTSSAGYSFRELTLIDSVEKSKLKLYQTTSLKNGVYLDFNSFKNQDPNYSIAEIKNRKGQISAIKTTTRVNLTPRDIYAYVYNGIPYISAEYGCYLLEKKNGDFYFIGKAGADPGEDHLSTPGSDFLMKVDHYSGIFMRVKKIR